MVVTSSEQNKQFTRQISKLIIIQKKIVNHVVGIVVRGMLKLNNGLYVALPLLFLGVLSVLA